MIVDLVFASGMYRELSVRSFIRIHSDFTFLLHDVWGICFFTGHSVISRFTGLVHL